MQGYPADRPDTLVPIQEDESMQIVLLGAPGSGKGTLAVTLAEIYQLPHISTGDIFRQNIKDNTPLGLEARQYIDSGALVPDQVTIAMVANRLAHPSCAAGFILDGFPRTVAQAEALTAILAEKHMPLSAVLNLIVSEKSILERLSGRRLCTSCGRGYNIHSMPSKVDGLCDDCGGKLIQRDDDKPATVLERLATYNRQTAPLIGYYAGLGLLIEVNNEGAVNASTAFVQAALNSLPPVRQKPT
jgi:adenylate kinase